MKMTQNKPTFDLNLKQNFHYKNNNTICTFINLMNMPTCKNKNSTKTR